MVNIADLINKGDVDISMNEVKDEDLEFRLAVTAEWDNIVESVKYL